MIIKSILIVEILYYSNVTKFMMRGEESINMPFCNENFDGKDMLDAHKKIDHVLINMM